MTHQSDIRSCGRLFSYSFIYLMNIAVVTVWVVAVSSSTFAEYFRRLTADVALVWGTIADGVGRALLWVGDFIR